MISSRPGGWHLDFARVFGPVARLPDERGHPYAVVGALGLHAWGQSRATFDLDLVTVFAGAGRSSAPPRGARLRDAARLPPRLLQGLADVQYLLGLPGTDRAEVKGYFDRAGMLEWYDRLIATL